MCGFIFISQSSSNRVSINNFVRALKSQDWRGPDAIHHIALKNERILIGHNRLSVLDLRANADQPMISNNDRYVIVFNGEIYNHQLLRKELKLQCRTSSDTETILEGYAQIGEKIIDLLEGMFAFVIYDKLADTWVCARDSLGIKPLYIYQTNNLTVIGSEPGIIADLCKLSVDQVAVEEWKVARRPTPGASYFLGLKEHLPGMLSRSDTSTTSYWKLKPSDKSYSQEEFESLLQESITTHEISDVVNVALLSGGLDSAVITGLSNIKKTYCIGLSENNEFAGAKDTADTLGRELVKVVVDNNDLVQSWRLLTSMRKEPLSVPNEGLIYLVCKSMNKDEKVVLTGEGADELLFGYDGIYRWACGDVWNGAESFLRRYGYSDEIKIPMRLLQFVDDEKEGKSVIEFVEDFFYKFHLPGLLRRMDFSSMAASKEARVPFVNRKIISYMYRRPPELKLSRLESKIPLRRLSMKIGLIGALNRKKVGFSASINTSNNKTMEYKSFQKIILEELEW
ncbi:asparagine synthase (glutamine-hydrolyzing) [Alcaligenaceae bacterium CGII-47]|nr:asparagine synthase (glutamine-hydrolyzing) [Alcaligenaceae bacterium CGII-47]